MKKIVILELSILVLLFVLGGCAITGKSVQKIDNTIKIGAVLPLTGVSSLYGQYSQEGVELALEEVNNNLGVNGQKLKIIYEDSQSKPVNAVTSLQKLIDVNKLSVFLVGMASHETVAQAPVAERNGVIILALGSAAEKIRYMGDYVFRIKVSVDKEMEELMKFSYKNLGARKIYILNVQNSFGESIKKFSEKTFISLGGEIVGSEGFLISEKDFKSYLIKVKYANPDLVVLGGWPGNNGQILKESKELGLDLKFVAPAGAMGQEVLKIGGNATDGVIYTMEYDSESNNPKSVKFRNKYLSKYGREPELFAAMGYDSVYVMQKVLNICGVDPICVKNELYKIKNFDGISGKFSFDSYGDVMKDLNFMIFKNEKRLKLNIKN